MADLLDPEALGYRFDSLDFADPMTRADAPKPDAGVAPVAVARLNLPAERIAEVRAAGASPSNRRVLLEFERLQVPLHPLCVRVFLNNPEARAETAAVGPTYAGTFTFLPIGTSGRGLEPVVSVQLEVSEALAAVLSDGGDVTVTLAPVPLRGRGIPDVPLQIENVTLTVGA